MSIEAIVGLVITATIAFLGLFGWSHKALKARQDEMEIELYKRPTFGDVRRTIEDKMSPIKVEYMSLARRIDEVKADQARVNDKLDKLISICTQLVHEKR